MATFIDNTTNNIETYINGTMICGCAYVVVIDNGDIQVAFDTIEKAKDYAKYLINYQIEPYEMFIDQLDGCIYDPAEVLK